MAVDPQSSDSEDENFNPALSIDADADESDNGNHKKSQKCRRFQKTRKTSNTSLPQKFENHNEQQHSSSNDDETKELNSIVNGNNERRTKPVLVKKFNRSMITTTTTTDDDIANQIHHYHPLDNLQSKFPSTPPPTTTRNESNLSSPIPTINASTNQPVVKKINRFQVKSIRKSQQQEILLANAAAAKSSNEDDCSVPNLQLKPSIIKRKSITTPTTDGENSTINTDNIINGTVSRLNPIENEHHHVRFHVTQREKKESTAEEDKLHNQTTASVTVSTPAPLSSAASAQGEVWNDLEKNF